MKSKKRFPLGVAVLTVIALGAWILAAITGGNLASAYQGVSIRFDNAAITKAMIEKADAEENDDRFTVRAAWERVPEKKAATSELDASAVLHKVIVYGDVNATGKLELLSGSLLMDDDVKGCLIDEDTAWRLFRTNDVIGAKVSLDGKEYIVRGIVRSFDPVLIARDEEAKYRNIEFSTDNFATAKQAVSTFLLKIGCSEEYVLIENGLFAKMIDSFVWSSAELFMIIIAVRLIRRALQNRLQRKSDYIYIAVGVLLAAASAAMISRTFFWPQAFLPSRWSDFAFYGKLLSGWFEQIDAIALTTPLPKEIEFFRSARMAVFLNVLTITIASSLMFVRHSCFLQRKRADENG